MGTLRKSKKGDMLSTKDVTLQIRMHITRETIPIEIDRSSSAKTARGARKKIEKPPPGSIGINRALEGGEAKGEGGECREDRDF